MNKLKKLRSGLAFNVISSIVMLLLLFSLLVSVIGYVSFTDAFEREYAESTYHMASTAATYVNGDGIKDYLYHGADAEYLDTKAKLDSYCDTMEVSIVYVIRVDTSDYNRFQSVFNSVNNSVDNTTYSPWELGHLRDTTNDEYRAKYVALYEQTVPYETVYRTRNLKNGIHPHITTLVPVKNSQGKVTALLCIQRPMKGLADGRRPYLRSIGISTAVLVVLVICSAILYIRRQYVKPIRSIADEATRFARENKKAQPLGKVSSIEEISALARSIDSMEEDMLRYIDNLTAITAEKERIGAELSVASTIQENSVPHAFPAFPERTEFDIYAYMAPAKEVGGDFYNYFFVDDDHLALVMADVSGKGVPAALFMMVTNIVINDRTRMGGTPAEILSYVNSRVCEHNPADMFVTVWLGILEISTGKVVAANAGHDDPVIYRRGEGFELLKNKHGLVVGAMPVCYKDYEFSLKTGDKLFLYTDGLPEATDKDNRMLGNEGMLEALNLCCEKSPEEILHSVKNSVDAFVGDAPQFDDLTMLCLEMKEVPNETSDH